MNRLTIRLFGKPSFEFDGAPWKWSAPPRCLPLLGLLTRAGAGMLSRALVASTLWPDELDSEARANLRRHLHRLTHSLPALDGVSWIAGDNLGVGWNDEAPALVDVRAFEEALEAGRLREAMELYRGEYLEGVYDDHVLARREHLRALAVDALMRLALECREARDFASSAAYAQRLLDIDEWREDALRAWMAATYESGERSAALAAYERFARRLNEEFSSEPGTETIALRDAIRAQTPLPSDPSEIIERNLSDVAHRGWKLPLVGRDAEFESLRAAWSRAARGSGSVAFLSGEAGIGKSRLAAELVALAQAQGGQALIGVTGNPEAEPYQSILVALRASLALIAHARLDETWLSALAHVLPELRGLRESLSAEELPADRARDRLFEAVARALEHLGRLRPLCLVLEDVHWAGPATIEMIAALARRLGSLRVLLVVTYRVEDPAVTEPLRKLRAALVAERRALAIPLDRLEADHVANVVRSVVGDEASKALGDGVMHLSEGNPLFVVQLIEGYLETGSVPDESLALRSVGDAISARARRLASKVRSIAEVAATIGQNFRADLVADTGGWDENAVLDAIGELMDRALVRESGGGLDYVFTHALIGAMFYHESPPEVRAVRHRRIATLLERDGDAAAGPIAHHWRMAGDRARAATAALRAGHAAFALYARGDAMAFAREALAASDDDRERFDALLLLSQAQVRYGDPDVWKADLEQLETVASRLDADERFAALEQRATFDQQTADRAHQLATIEAMLALATEAGSAAKRSVALAMLGRLHALEGRLHQSVETLRTALPLALEAHAAGVELDIRYYLAHGLSRIGRYDEAHEHVVAMRGGGAEDALARRRRLRALQIEVAISASRQDIGSHAVAEELLVEARAIGDLELEVLALKQLAGAEQKTLGAHVRDRYREAMEIAERIDYEVGQEALSIDLAAFEARIGNHAEAIRGLERGATYARKNQSHSNYALCKANIARELLLVGDPFGARAAAEEALELAGDIAERRLQAASLCALGIAKFHTGEPDGGLAMLCEGIAARREIGDRTGLAADLCEYADAVLELGRAPEYAGVIDELRSLEADWESFEQPVRLCYTVGRLLEATGDSVAAEQAFERGARLFGEQLAAVSDEEIRGYVSALPFNRALAGRLTQNGTGRETRKARRSS